MQKNTIEVNDLKVYTNHGCLDEEGRIGGHYILDIKIETDFSKAYESDDLDDTVCYVDLSRIAYEEMAKRDKLIERAGNRILKRIKAELKNVNRCQIRVTKVSPPIPGEIGRVSIVIKD